MDFDADQLDRGSIEWVKRHVAEAKSLCVSIEKSYITLARILYDLWAVPVGNNPANMQSFTLMGYEDFNEFARKELNMDSAKAAQFRKIWHMIEIKLSNLDTPTKDRLYKVGWTKLVLLSKVLSEHNVLKWLELAEKTSLAELRAAIRTSLNTTKENAVPEEDGKPKEETLGNEDPQPPALEDVESQKHLTFLLPESAYVNVSLALKKAGKVAETADRNRQFDLIALDFLASNNWTEDAGLNRSLFLAKVEKTLGCKLVAIKPEDKSIVFGETSLKELVHE